MGNPDLSREDRRGLVIFPALPAPPRRSGEWWLVLVAFALAALMTGIGFAIR